MALQDMIVFVQDEVHKEVDNQINRANIEARQELIAYGEQIEKRHDDKLYDLERQLKKKEEALKAEQDCAYKSTQLQRESTFIEQVLEDIDKVLFEYIINAEDKRKALYQKWLIKIRDNVVSSRFDIQVNASDEKILTQVMAELSLPGQIEVVSKISSGLLIVADDNITIDLTYTNLFKERKQNILNKIMQILKEDLWKQ